jgi:hypothetical protein
MITVGTAAAILFNLAVTVNGTPARLSMALGMALATGGAGSNVTPIVEMNTMGYTAAPFAVVSSGSATEGLVEQRTGPATSQLFALASTALVQDMSLNLETNQLTAITFNPVAGIVLVDPLPVSPVRAK